MAKKGTFTALQRLRPIYTDFGDIIEEGVDDILARRKAEEEAEEAEKEKKAKMAKQFGTDYAGLVDVVTKTKSIDEAFARGINAARDEMGLTFKAIEADPTKANTIESQVKMSNLKNFSKNLKLISDRYSKYATDVSTGMSDGTLSQWNSGVLSDMDSIFRQANLDVKVDKETGLPIAVIAELDANGKPTGELKELNLVEVLDGRGMSRTVNTFDFQKSVTDIGTKLGKREIKEPGSGFKHIEYQQFEDIEPQVRAMIQGFIGNAEAPSDIAKSIWSDVMSEAPKKLTEEDMKRIEDFYTNSIKGFYDEKNKETIDYGARNAAARLAREEAEKRGRGIQLRTDVTGRPLREGLTGATGDIGGGAFSFTLPKKVTMGIKGENREITNIYLTDGGTIGFEETVYKGKATGKLIDPDDFAAGNYSGEVITETRVRGGFSNTQLNDIATELGFNNAGELRKSLEDIANTGTGTEEAKKEAETIDTSKYNN